MGKYKYHLLMHVIIIIWGFTGILGKLIELSADILVWYRIIFAFIGLLFLLPFFKVPFKLARKKDLWKLVLVGVITALHWVAFYKAISLSTASLAVLCLSTTTLHVSWIDPIIMKRKFSWIEGLFGLLVIYGIYFVSSDFKPEEYEALAYGLVAALLAAIFSVSNAKLVQTIPSAQISLYEMLTGIIFLTVVLLANGNMNMEALAMTTSDFWWLIVLGVVCTSFPFMLMIDVVKQLGAFTASLTINLEPVYTMILAIVILQENQELSYNFYFGALMIVLVVVANTIVKSKMRKKNILPFKKV